MWIEYLTTTDNPIRAQRPQAQFNPDTVFLLPEAQLHHLLEKFRDWRPTLRVLTTEETHLISTGLGPPQTYFEYPSKLVNVAGTLFKASLKAKVGEYSHKHMPMAAFMAVRTVDNEQTYFGVIRRILCIPLLGNDGNRDMIFADWFAAPPVAEQLHPILKVPVVLRTKLPDGDFGNLWDVYNIVPTHITFMPNLVRQGATPSNKEKAARQLVVLSRDANLTELAHPAWGPSANLNANLDGEGYRVFRRTTDNTNITLEQQRDLEAIAAITITEEPEEALEEAEAEVVILSGGEDDEEREDEGADQGQEGVAEEVKSGPSSPEDSSSEDEGVGGRPAPLPPPPQHRYNTRRR